MEELIKRLLEEVSSHLYEEEDRISGRVIAMSFCEPNKEDEQEALERLGEEFKWILEDFISSDRMNIIQKWEKSK